MALLPRPIPAFRAQSTDTDINTLWESVRAMHEYLQALAAEQEQLQSEYAEYVEATQQTLTDMQAQIDALDAIVNP